jgi:hypothetical protein
MNMSMNTQRLTISLPDYLYDQLMMMYGRGEVSKFMSEAAERLIVDKKIETKINPVEDFINFRNSAKFPKMTDRQIKKAINRGRA